jgi:hypothetical protein
MVTTSSIFQLHNWTENKLVDICGILCIENLKGSISKWQWKWNRTFRCDSKVAVIVSDAFTHPQMNQWNGLSKIFINKGTAAAQIKSQDFQC